MPRADSIWGILPDLSSGTDDSLAHLNGATIHQPIHAGRESSGMNTFACAGPDWESVYLQRVRRNAQAAAKWRQNLLPVNYALPVSSLELGNLAGNEITVCAPGASDIFRHRLAGLLIEAGANLVVTVSDVGSISVYRDMP